MATGILLFITLVTRVPATITATRVYLTGSRGQHGVAWTKTTMEESRHANHEKALERHSHSEWSNARELVASIRAPCRRLRLSRMSHTGWRRSSQRPAQGPCAHQAHSPGERTRSRCNRCDASQRSSQSRRYNRATNNWPLWLNAQQLAITAPVSRNRDR
uniref:Secreted protein n=1 Tax=Timema bartmani TaxID=61472 RepID=A0A7R9I1V4_9NEOP|nr:unnamed protein product [Timema bartmani]